MRKASTSDDNYCQFNVEDLEQAISCVGYYRRYMIPGFYGKHRCSISGLYQLPQLTEQDLGPEVARRVLDEMCSPGYKSLFIFKNPKSVLEAPGKRAEAIKQKKQNAQQYSKSAQQPNKTKKNVVHSEKSAQQAEKSAQQAEKSAQQAEMGALEADLSAQQKNAQQL